MPKPQVYLRADGNPKIGLGHVVRSLALAEILKEEFDCTFIIKKPLPSLKRLVRSICNSIIEIDEFNDILLEAKIMKEYFNKSDIVVIDGYNYDTNYQKELKSSGCKLVAIDDIYSFHFVSDVIINHGASITEDLYSRESYTKLYLGIDYALLRKPFRNIAKNKVKKPNGLFICFGGSDPNNNVLSVIEKLIEMKYNLEIHIVVGEGYKYLDDLNTTICNSGLCIDLHVNISAEKMVKIMNRCNKAITSPSSISYEYLSTGGTLFLKLTAENQKDLYDYLVTNNIGFDFSQFDLATTTQFDSSNRSNSLFRGQQEMNLLRIFKTIDNGH